MLVNPTPNDAANHNVFGTDGVRPIWYPQGMWRTLAMHEVYLGKEGSRTIDGEVIPLYVANVLDYIEDVRTHITYQVVELPKTGPNALVPVYEPVVRNAGVLTSKDILVALGPGYGSADHKITIDDTVYPYRLDVSPFVCIRSVEAHYAKIIEGSTYTGNYKTVGFMLSSTGKLEDDKIPLDLIADVNGVTNYHIKNVRVSFCNTTYKNGDVLTLALYTKAGHLLSEHQLVVTNSNFMRDGTAPREYIKTVYMESPYLSETNPFELHIPMGWNNNSLNMMGVIEYKSGRKVKMPIDGNKFKLEGLQQVISTIAGHEYNLMLKYVLDVTENTVHDVSGWGKFIAQPYRVRVVKANNSYTVKLYAYPYWDAATVGYKLRFFVVNLDRNQFLDVTPVVKFVAGTPVFDGTKLGSVQQLRVSVNLKDIFSTYKPFIHTQLIDITLYGTPGDFEAPWTVKQSTDQDPTTYGNGLFAKKSPDSKSINISNGLSFDEWKLRMFDQTYPLLSDTSNVKSYPEATDFEIRNGTSRSEYHIEKWNENLPIKGQIKVHNNIEVIWKHKTPTEEMILSVSSFIIQP